MSTACTILSSVQDASAKIGRGCRIGPSVVIGPNVTIEDGNMYCSGLVYTCSFWFFIPKIG